MKQTAASHITLLKGIVTALCLMMICPLQCYSQVEKVNKPVRNRSGVHQPVSTATDSTATNDVTGMPRQPMCSTPKATQ